MKGDYEYITDFVGVAVFAGTVLALIIFLQVSFVKFNADMKVSVDSLQAVDAAHIIKECFSKGEDSIQASTVKNIQLCTDCKICSFDAGAKLEYLEGPNKGTKIYDYNYAENGNVHKIFVTVTDGTNNYVSRLSVSVSLKSPVTYII